MRSRIVSCFSDALASSNVPVLDAATRYTELGDALLPLINPVMQEQVRPGDRHSSSSRTSPYPKEVEEAIDKRSCDGRGRRSQRVRQVPDGAGDGRQGGGGAGGMATELAVGFAIAQQMMQQQGGTWRGGGAPGPVRPSPTPDAGQGRTLAGAPDPGPGRRGPGGLRGRRDGRHRERRAQGEEDRDRRGGSSGRRSSRTWRRLSPVAMRLPSTSSGGPSHD